MIKPESVERLGNTIRVMNNGNLVAQGHIRESFVGAGISHKVAIDEVLDGTDGIEPGTTSLLVRDSEIRKPQVYEVRIAMEKGQWNNRQQRVVVHRVVIDRIEQMPGTEEFMTTARTVERSSDGTAKDTTLRFGPKIEFTPIDDNLPDRSGS